MIEMRDMEMLVSLARHRHFAKAAAACRISQPALSMRLRNLEESLGIAIVRRGNRFLGFTEQGELLVSRARGILDDAEALLQELTAADGRIAGVLRLGVIPSALAYASMLTINLKSVSPGVSVRIESASSMAIQQGIESGALDAGVTYQDGASPDLLGVSPLYEERYVLLCPEKLAPSGAVSISWRAAAELPLCLLEPSMQNRRILNRMFMELGAAPNVVSEANVFTTALVMAREGLAATIIPEILSTALGDLGGTRALPLTEPELRKSICLIYPLRTPRLPVVEALRRLVADPA